MRFGLTRRVISDVKWFAPVSGLFLAMAYVHYAFVSEIGGNPAWVVGWLILFVACGGIALTNTLMRSQPAAVADMAETLLISSALLSRAFLKKPLLKTYDGPVLVAPPRLKGRAGRGTGKERVSSSMRTPTRLPLRPSRAR